MLNMKKKDLPIVEKEILNRISYLLDRLTNLCLLASDVLLGIRQLFVLPFYLKNAGLGIIIIN